MKIFFLAILILVSGCASLSQKHEPTPAITESDFWAAQAKRREFLSSVSGKVWVKYRGPKEGLAGKGRLTFKTPSEGRWELRDPLGRVQYLAVLSPGEFIAYYPSQKLAFHEEDSGRLYSKYFLGMEIGFPEIQRLMLGVLPQPAEELKGARLVEWKWDGSRGMYRGVFGRLEPLTFYVSPDGKEIREIDWALTKDTVHVRYGDFDNCCDKEVGFPFASKLALEKAKTSVQLQWDDVDNWKAAANEEAFQLALPEGTEVRRLK